MIRATSALAAACWLAGAWCAIAEPRIQWVRNDSGVVIEVHGLDPSALGDVRSWPDEKLRALLSVRVQEPDAPPMLGVVQAGGSVLRFIPRFPLSAGVAYRADLDLGQLPGAKEARRLTSEHTVPAPAAGPPTVVTEIYPTAEVIPENLLKFYLQFSAPMSRGHIYEHIHLRDEAGNDVELPFLEIDEELWDPEMKRLTLFIDPGRIKREVRPLEEIGPALQDGHRFTLVIDTAWKDAAGRPLGKPYQRAFRVGPPDRTAIVPQKWEIAAPAKGTTAPLRVDFGEPLDHALALRLLRVATLNRKPVGGTSALSNAEQTWTFTPEEPWQEGTYQILVPTTLEDLAGNNVGKAFEVDLRERGAQVETARTVRVSFEVK